MTFCLLAAAFFSAWVLMFVHPGAAILMFWLGICVFGVSALADSFAARAERRQSLREHEGSRSQKA